ncbi:hypothetical protein UPYG_G00031590 [Umbra pygmaea]|uniref:Secreted protein n=1 Tax=Umbra pygmaea TaxID=75934 RepID=A0ABD0Y1I2_UMBPY
MTMLPTETLLLKWTRALLVLWLHQAVLETAEAIHPECALVSQYMKALEKAHERCIRTRRLESRNRSSRTGLLEENTGACSRSLTGISSCLYCYTRCCTRCCSMLFY